ncbi:cytochrome P450 [Myxozyma melibiosi]|uniref:Cytochrome P450 n=1 Tax=Myxozyma melibiosi TaxID=54550 RepID=A0ABR1FAT0_9ASCO
MIEITFLHVVAAIVAVPLVIILLDLRRVLRMPPGPFPLPFIGNKLIIPQSKPWITFQEWSYKYGPIFTIWIGRRPTVIISDPVIAAELMEKRSTKYSSRPRFVTMGELYNKMSTILVQPYGKEWTIRRKLLHQALNPSALRLYKPIQTAEASRLCHQLIESPADYEMLVDRFTSGIVFAVAYGHRIDSFDAKVIRRRLEFMQYMSSLNVPGAYLVESLPFLKYIPNVLAPWKKTIEEKGYEEARDSLALFNSVRTEMQAAAAKGEEVADSLAKLLITMNEKEPIPLSQRDIASVPSSLFGAGSDTTASTICSSILAMVTHPEALRAAQAELDAVIGPDRSPTFDDELKLPFLKAFMKETLRWRPVAVLGGTPHSSSEDDVYNGYLIPKNTTILGNSWAINLNEKYYPNPHHFNPKRFLDDAVVPKYASEKDDMEKGVAHPNRDGHSSFGWGRRVCPGAGIAWNNLYIALAKLIWGFDIMPIPGVKYDTFDYTEGFNSRPNHFECIIRPRSEHHKEVLEREYEAALETVMKLPPFE